MAATLPWPRSAKGWRARSPAADSSRWSRARPVSERARSPGRSRAKPRRGAPSSPGDTRGSSRTRRRTFRSGRACARSASTPGRTRSTITTRATPSTSGRTSWPRSRARRPNATSVWVLEDLHAADIGTLDLLDVPRPAAPRHARARRRDDAREGSAPDRSHDRRGSRAWRATGWPCLSSASPSATSRRSPEETLGRAVPEAAVRRLAELTGGNPLFAVECARAFRSAGGIEGTLRIAPAHRAAGGARSRGLAARRRRATRSPAARCSAASSSPRRSRGWTARSRLA